MSDAVIIALVGGFVSVVGAFFSYRAAVVSKETAAIAKETHTVVNSRMDTLLELAQTSSKAEGKLEEKNEAEARVDKVGES